MLRVSLLLFSLCLCAFAQQQLVYNINDEYVFDFYGQVNHGVLPQDSNAPTPEVSSSSMSGLMEMQMQQFDGQNFLFVMNLFNVDVQSWTGPPPSPSHMKEQLKKSRSKNSRLQKNGDDGGLGPDMFFTMTPQGQIVDIWYQDGDSPFFIHVKTSAINSLQTRIVPANRGSKLVLESDLVGIHNSNYVARQGSYGLAITKNFTQKDVLQFADYNVTQSTFQLFGQSNVAIHPAGYILSTVCKQEFLLVSSSVGSNNKRGNQAGLGFDSNIHSTGGFNLEINPNNKNHAFRLGSVFASVNKKSKTTLLEISKSASLSLSSTINIPEYKNIASVSAAILASPKTDFAELKKIAKYFNNKKENIPTFSQFVFENAPSPQTEEHAKLVIRWFYILGYLNIEESNTILKQSLSNYNYKSEALRTLISSRVSECSFLPLLSPMVKDDEWRHETITAYSSVAQRCACNLKKAEAKKFLLSLLRDALVKNDQPLAKLLTSGLRMINSGVAASRSIVSNSDFPFNKSYTKDVTLGGELLSAQFEFNAFLGTNFDCNQQYFNYEASAYASANIDFLGNVTNAFLAQLAYGVKNGVALQNDVSVTVFDKLLYHQSLPAPSLDCSVHTEPIVQLSWPGYEVSYAVWVSVIPVAFSASIDLDLSVNVGWNVCVPELSAMIELVPNGRLVASGSAMSYLLIVEGGVNLNAEFDITPTPQAYVHGSMCSAGFDVQVTYDPMKADVDVWYRAESCYLWIFDCHWGPYNTDTLWGFDTGKRTDTLVNQTWKIAP